MKSVLVIPETNDWFELDEPGSPNSYPPYVLHMTDEQFKTFRDYDKPLRHVTDEKMRLPAKFNQFRVVGIEER